MDITNLDHKMKNGVLTKSLFVKHLEVELWRDLEEIKKSNSLPSFADAVRLAIKKAAGKA